MSLFAHWMLQRRAPLLHVAGDRGTGPPVILVHGIASSSVTFEFVVPLIADDHRVISIDLLGFGGSPAPADAQYTIEEHVASLDRTIRELQLDEPFVLVGHSLGCLIAARYAATRKRNVSRLVLVAPPIYLTPDAVPDPLERAAMGGYMRAYEFLRTNKQFTMRAAAALGRLTPIKNVLEVTEQNWTAFVRSLEHVIESQTAVADIAAVDAPIHIVYGTLDPFLTPAGLRIVEQMRHVETHRVDAVDHVIRKRMARVVATAIG
ncbi:alpha/beta fold hydrolase [Ruicaihuangia caeni]|uniref:alpha/beta fold hydrolase n=1 Tax=Ruicaihuangia caeni TaxID=3042517 RepID=UPI00338D5D3A